MSNPLGPEFSNFVDVLFVDTKGDLNVYYKSGDQQTSKAGCCSTPMVPGTKSEIPTYDINEWVGKYFFFKIRVLCSSSLCVLVGLRYLGSYQIYAMKETSTSTQSSTSGNVLLRWWDAFPKAISSPVPISAEEVATLIRKGGTGSSDFAVIDVRRDDHAVRFSSLSEDFKKTQMSNKISY